MLDEESRVMRDAHFAGANGSEVVQRRTGLVDKVLREIYDGLAGPGPLPALVAVGGYGRGELNPYSDIDILFLCRDESDRRRSPEMLYQLWDAGLDVGYSVRTISECAELAGTDIKIRTSLMESRLIAGDASLYHDFLRTMRSDVFYRKASTFIKEKVSERSFVRGKYGGSIYLREPNIKEGPGGLRDIHSAFWIAFAKLRISFLGELTGMGVITPGEHAVFVRSRNFLWRLRNEIHYISDRKSDQLTFEMQERAALDFGYRDSTNLLAVERFMKTYFMHAKNIREFANKITEAVLRKAVRREYRKALSIGPFSLLGKTLVPASEDVIREDPVQILAAFEIMQTRHAVFSEALKTMIRSRKIDDTVRTSSSGAAIFLSILNSPGNLYETLSLMKDLRFLGRYIPEFRTIQSLAKHDYYHTYTVDEHTLYAIRNLQDLWSGRYPARSSLSDALRSVRKPWVLMLAVLLHDLGKAYRSGHEHRGVTPAGNVLARLALDHDDRERIVFLIKNHLAMSTLSQRRELTDRNVIADFARHVGDRENLTMLYLLTYADIAAVSPSSWTQWKATLLQDLYVRTRSHFDESEASVEAEQVRVDSAADLLTSAAKGLFTREEVDAFLSVMPTTYVLSIPTSRALHHLTMKKRLPDEQLVIQHRHYPEKGYTELTVCAYDAYGMLYRTAGTLAAKSLNILRAQAYTAKNGVMFDIFQITDPEGNISPYDDVWESVKSELRTALMNGYRPPEAGLYSPRKPLPGPVFCSVEFDNETSDSFTIIDVEAADRVGILSTITRTLYELNLDIASAKIVTEGARALDSFYVCDLLKQKIYDQERIAKIRSVLLSVLERDSNH